MIIFYKHRQNNFSNLNILYKKKLYENGIECDLRYHKGKEYLDHDINKTINNYFLDYQKEEFKDLHVIINFKETGLEINTFKKFFKLFKSTLVLDIPFPEYVKFKKQGLGKHIIWRLSEYEKPSVSTIKSFDGEWIWLDSFNYYWFDESQLTNYKKEGLKIILVSNELQGRDIKDNFAIVKELMQKKIFDAVCTKSVEFYLEMLK